MNRDARARLSARGRGGPSLYGPTVTRNCGTITHADRFGTDVCVRSKAPPPVAEYDAYLLGRNVPHVDVVNGTGKTGFRLRRIVIMRREGCTWKECGEAAGVCSTTAREWVELLPLELAV